MIKLKDTILIPLLTSLVALSIFATDIYLPSLPEITKYFDTSISMSQLTLSSYMFGFALSMLISGPLSDRFGRKPIIIAGLLLFFLGTVWCLFTTTIYSLIMARFFQALGGCCGTVLGRVVVRDLYTHQDSSIKILSYIAMGMSLSPALAPILGGFLESGFGWHACFIVLLAASILLIIAVYLLLPETCSHLNKNATNPTFLFRNYCLAFKNRDFIAYTAAITFAWCGYFAFISASSFIFIDTLNYNPYEFGIIYSIVVACYTLGTYLAKRMAGIFTPSKLVFSCILIIILMSLILLMLAITCTVSATTIMLPMSIYLIVVGVLMPNSQAAAMAPFDKNIGAIAGLLYFVEFFIASLAGIFVGRTQAVVPQIPQLGMTLVILTSSLCMLILFYLCQFKQKKYRVKFSKKDLSST